MFENQYGWSTGPVQLPDRTRKTAIWISPWVEYGRPVIMDTGALDAPAFDSKRRIDLAVDETVRRRLAGRDELPADTLLVIIHPKTYADLRMRRDTMFLTGPDAAAAMIDGVCRQTPGLEQRMRWKVLGTLADDDFI
jgi:hypothetical protein